jgi:glucosamine--fructose-6-phosphate aminotransferase (isomerizing)
MTDTRPEWLTDGWPEFRAAAPWVMAEMVAGQPDLVAPMLANPVASDIARLALDAAGAGAPIVVSGCGTSEHGAMAIGRLLDEALRARGHRGGLVEVRQALDAALDPRPGGLFIAITHDGGTRATNLAAEAAREAGARIALVTYSPDAPAAAIADAVFLTPIHDDSWCHTVAYTSSIMAGGAIASAVIGTRVDPAPLTDYLSRAVAEDGQVNALADTLDGAAPLVIAGAGADEITARELALKVEEGPRLPAVARHMETWLHGHLAATGPATRLLLIALDPLGARRDARLVLASLASREAGIVPAAILSPEASAIPGLVAPGGRMVLPAAPACPLPSLPALLGGAAALQRLTLALSDRAGVNPDLIRREDAPFRDAAAIAEASTDW